MQITADALRQAQAGVCTDHGPPFIAVYVHVIHHLLPLCDAGCRTHHDPSSVVTPRPKSVGRLFLAAAGLHLRYKSCMIQSYRLYSIYMQMYL